jgi:ketosteroid isomerase-like protein
MKNETSNLDNAALVRQVINQWAYATRKGHHEDVLVNHADNVLIFDVLPPMKYEGAAAYRRSWDEWQPDTQGEGTFELLDLVVIPGAEISFAHCFIHCGGALPDGSTFEDLVRATFCLQKFDTQWKVTHQHISKPFE